MHHVPDLEPEHEVVVAESRPRSLGIFNRRSKAPAEYISGNSSTTSVLRSRSVDRNNGSEMSQKGERLFYTNHSLLLILSFHY